MTVLTAHRHPDPLIPGAELADSDAALLDFLTGPVPPHKLVAKPRPKNILPRRDAALDPLLMAAAAASGPHVTRNHYHHDFFPGVMLPTSEGSWDWSRFSGSTQGSGASGHAEKRYRYVSKQAPRRERMMRGEIPADSEPHTQPSSTQAVRATPSTRPLRTLPIDRSPSTPLVVQCMVRTRVPTPHGEVFLHLYHNNKDEKEHLAVVVDPAQLLPSDDPVVRMRLELGIRDIRSRSLDEKWSEDETETDRIIRGAYVGRLDQSSRPSRTSSSAASKPPSSSPSHPSTSTIEIPPPLMRIHSECFTGETIGSMRCDCGEQLDEAIRRIFEPIVISLPPSSPSSTPSLASSHSSSPTASSPSASSPTPTQITLPPRGLLVYLRQEGRNIGLLSKLRAYNLQDMGYDTVEANEMLGFGADERGYGIVGGVLRDLGLAPPTSSTNMDAAEAPGLGVRLLTNNPLKVQALEKEGVKVVERVEMVPRSWLSRDSNPESSQQPPLNASALTNQLPKASSLALGIPIHPSSSSSLLLAPPPRPPVSQTNSHQKGGTAGLMGSHTPYGPDLDKYLRTKVQKMGHVLPKLWDASLDSSHGLQHGHNGERQEYGSTRDGGDGVRVVEPSGGF